MPYSNRMHVCLFVLDLLGPLVLALYVCKTVMLMKILPLTDLLDRTLLFNSTLNYLKYQNSTNLKF